MTRELSGSQGKRRRRGQRRRSHRRIHSGDHAHQDRPSEAGQRRRYRNHQRPLVLRSGRPRQAIVDGSAATFRVILAAVSVMVVVFGSFVLNDQRVVNLFGFGLATAIATYAAVAMLALAPATLALLGRAAWWLPGRGSLTPRRDGDPTRWPRQATASARDDQAASPASPIEQ